MKYELPPIEVEYAFVICSTPTTILAIGGDDEHPYIIKLKDGVEISRRPVEDYGLTSRVGITDDTYLPELFLYANGLELLRTDGLYNWAYDGDILTDNHNRTVEEGIKAFEEIAILTIRTEGKIIFVLE